MDKQTTFVWWLTIISLAALGFTYFHMQEQYVHPQPEKDCSIPNEYPVCTMVGTGTEAPPPTSHAMLIGTATMALLMLLSVIFGFIASVMSQQNLVVSDTKTKRHDVPEHKTTKPGTPQTAPTIVNNQVPPEIVQPTKAPAQGPGARNG